MADLTVIIPARNEPYLEKTIRNVLENARGNTEVIAILDGYLPDPQINIGDDRVTFVHYKESIGQRQGINAAAKMSTAKFIMKLDAHCAVAEGFDVELMNSCEYDWTMIPRMYNLDIKTWQPKLHKRTDYMFIGWNEKDEIRALYYDNGLRQPKNDIEIDDIMCCMGPCFFMHRERFWELGGCDENHGSWGQQGVEVACKAWLSGGALKVNKRTWFAHWFRGGEGPGFPYPLSGRQVKDARSYSKNLWLNNKWEKQTRPFQFLLDKFNPPTWEVKGVRIPDRRENPLYRHFKADGGKDMIGAEYAKNSDLFKVFMNNHVHRNDPKWRGVPLVKFATDIVMYQMVIWEKRPDFIVEIGTDMGGSALMFADLLAMTGKGKVISIDPKPRSTPEHKDIIYLKGDSKDDTIIEQVRQLVGNGSVMMSIDGLHTENQVKWELKKYRHIVTSGQFMVVEDCYGKKGELVGPGKARDWFLNWCKQFTLTNFDDQFLVGVTRHGWLLKK